jgi:hypothetical protein
MHNKGIGKEISIVRPWYKIMISQFFTYILFCCKKKFGFFFHKSDRCFWGEGVAKFMPIGYNFNFFFK